jgi:hypothetical protein
MNRELTKFRDRFREPAFLPVPLTIIFGEGGAPRRILHSFIIFIHSFSTIALGQQAAFTL